MYNADFPHEAKVIYYEYIEATVVVFWEIWPDLNHVQYGSSLSDCP
jgi:hypothetical protein